MTSSSPGDGITLDDVVARVRELPTGFRSLYVETDGWTDWVLSQRASARMQNLLVPPPPVDPTSPRQRTEHHVRTWMVFDPEHWEHPLIGVTPARHRVELEYTHTDRSVTYVVSGRDDTARWSERDGEAERSDPRGVGSLHSFWVVGRQWIGDRVRRELVDDGVEVLGVRCARVHITPPPGHWAPGPLHVGDEHRLDVDVETGMTLALTSFVDDEIFQHYEVLALEVDPDIDTGLTAPPSDAAPRAPSTYRDEGEVARDVDDLVLLVPRWLPDGYAFGTAGARAMEDGEMTAVLYYRRDGSPTVMIHERPAPPVVPDTVEGWTWVERGDRRVIVSDVTDAVGVRLAGTIVGGTVAQLHAELSADELLDVAFSLEPVRA